MKIVRPEHWYMVWWGVAGTAYLVLQMVGTYYAVLWAIQRVLAEGR